jgi:parallel beta-helix repeat protein
MKRQILITFCLIVLITIRAFSQRTWVPFMQQNESAPTVALSSSNNSIVSFSVQINGISVTQKLVNDTTYQIITIPGGQVMGIQGSPEVPMITKLIAIPDCDNVTISISPSNQLEYSNYNVIPSPRLDPNHGYIEVYEINNSVYSTNALYPGKNGEIVETGYVRSQKVATVALYPVQFNPVNKTISVFTNFNVTLSFVNPKSAVNKELGIFQNMMHHAALNFVPDSLSASKKITGTTQGNVLSKTSLKRATASTSGSVTWVTNLNNLVGSSAIPADYLIITDTNLVNSAALSTLANYRFNHNGFDVVIVKVEDIYAYFPPTQTNPSYVSIRNFLANVYNNGTANHTGDGHLAYLLLAGDAYQDDNTIVMVPAAYPKYQNQDWSSANDSAGDYYYSCLTQSGGIYDDDQDIMYGRLSVGDTTELRNTVNKIINYESNTNGNWNENYTFVSGSPDLWASYSDTAISAMTNMIPSNLSKGYAYRNYTTDPPTTVTAPNTSFEPLSFDSAQYADSTKMCGWSVLNTWLYNQLNSNNIHTFIYEGHAGWNALVANEGSGRYIFYLKGTNGNSNDPNDTYSVNNQLKNTFNAFMILDCCDAGHFDNGGGQWSGVITGDCLAEYLVNEANYGAIGCVAASRPSEQYAFGVVDQGILNAQYNSHSYIMGEAVMESKLALTAQEYLLYKRQYNLYGDPAVNLWPTKNNNTVYLLSGNVNISSSYTVPAGVTVTIQPGTTLNFASGVTMTVNGTLIVNGGNSASPVTFNFVLANQNITIAYGASMQVASGATLNFSNGSTLYASSGTLTAVGTSSNPITFNFNSGGCIVLNGPGSSSSSLQYATINNAYYGVMFSTGANGTIQNCILNNCTYGVYIYYSSPQVLNNQIINPSTGFIYIYGSSSNPVVSGNTYTYQGNGPTLSGTVNITSSLTVNAGTTLTIQPGTTLNFASGTTLVVNGTLFVNGGNPVTFNYADAGQNLYILGSGSMQVAPGATLNFPNGSALTVTGTLTAVGIASALITFNFCSSGYIQLYGPGTSNSSVQYAVINNPPVGIMFTMGSNGSIQNCTLNNCQYGVWIYSSSPTVLNNQIVNPSIEGIRIDGTSSNPTISGNVITNPGGGGTTLSGNVNITSSLTVNTGTTLTILPGTTLNFASGTTMTVNGILDVKGGNPVTFNYADAGQNLYILGSGRMQVDPGATLNFSNGSALTVTGTLTAVGTSSNGITFNFNALGYIQLYGPGTSSSVVQYATINNAPHGIMFTTGSNGSIQNCVINHCNYGVYVYNSSPQILNNQIINPLTDGMYIDVSASSPTIYGNTIKSTNGYSSVGIYAANSSLPYIAQNKIGGFNYGVYIGGGSFASFTVPPGSTPFPNNLITGNVFGLTAAWGGTIYGGNFYTGGGENSVYNNANFDAYSNSSGTLYAELDYWGSSPKRFWDSSSQLYFDLAISSDPWGGVTPSVNQENNSKQGDIVQSVTLPSPVVADSSSSDLFTAFNLEAKGDSIGVVNQYLSMLAKDSYADLAITKLFKLIKQYSRKDLLTYFGSFSSSNKHFPLIFKLIADNNLQTGQFDKAISAYANLTKNYPKDYLGINAQFQELFAYANIKKDKATAQQILTQIKALNLTDPIWITQMQMADNLISGLNSSMNKNQAIVGFQNSESEIIPKEYALSNNYPNPFNPSTVINYQIPKDGIVTLIVYDILGREVRTLVNEYKSAGIYSVNFDASKFASGVYIYQLKAGSFISTKKMLFMK